MATLLALMFIAALVGAVLWNHRNRDIATSGIEFVVPASERDTVEAIRSAYCGGAKAAAKSLISGLTVSPSGTASFGYVSRIGDEGEIEVAAQSPDTATIRARATAVYIGSHPISHSHRGYWGFCSMLAHRIYMLLGIAPNAAKLKRFHNRLRLRVLRQLARSSV